VRRAGSELAGWWVCAVAADRVLAPLELHLNTTAAVRQTVLQHKAHVRYGPTRAVSHRERAVARCPLC
jgi:hypothetical protein